MEKMNIDIAKLIKNAASTILLVLLAITASVLVLATMDTPLKLRVFNVTSGSMEPKIKLGTLVFVRSEEEYKRDDIITFYPKALTKETVTHRIVSVGEDPETKRVTYRTKGDANESEDMNTIPKEFIIGKVKFKIPYIGYVLAFTKTQLGFILLIVIPATIIIWSELGVIKEEAIGFYKNYKSKKLEKKENV